MKRAALAGIATVLGWALALWAVYQKPRMDWPEFALVISAGLIVYGTMWVKEFISQIVKEGANET